MRRLFALLLTLCLICGCSSSPPRSYQDRYNGEAAAAYARAYVTERNPEYVTFNKNCSNFVSQCLVAGGMQMDQGPAPRQDKRIYYVDSGNRWYSEGMQFESERPPCYAVGTPFVRTVDFIAYWTKQRGKELREYPNTFDGRDALIAEASIGDVILFYSSNQSDDYHIGLITRVEAGNVYYCANTTDRLDYSICGFNDELYPKFGVIIMKTEEEHG